MTEQVGSEDQEEDRYKRMPWPYMYGTCHMFDAIWNPVQAGTSHFC